MKRLLFIVLMVSISFAFAACDINNDTPNVPEIQETSGQEEVKSDIIHTLPASPPAPSTPVSTPTPLPSLAESVIPIGNTFAADGDNIFVIKEDAGLWRLGQSDEPIHILDNVISVWAGWPSDGLFIHRTDGSLWRCDSLGSAPSLFLENVAYFDGRFSVIKLDGSLWFWSWDNIPIHVMDDVVAFSTWLPGSGSYMATTSDSRLWGWGDNWAGVVGDGTDEYRREPVLIMENIAAVSVARTHVAALCHDGYLWAWGDNWVDIGDGVYYTGFSPARVMDNVVAISADTNSGPNPSANTLAIRTDGSLWGWGWDSGWNIGLEFSPTPTKIWDDASHIIRGWRSVMVITSNGELWDLTHEPVMILERVAAAINIQPRLALDFDGVLWAWEGDFDLFGDTPRPFGISDDPRHLPEQIMGGVLLP